MGSQAQVHKGNENERPNKISIDWGLVRLMNGTVSCPFISNHRVCERENIIEYFYSQNLATLYLEIVLKYSQVEKSPPYVE